MALPKVRSTQRQHSMDALWDANAEKYLVTVYKNHLTEVARFIGLMYIIDIFIFTLGLLLVYMVDDVKIDTWLKQTATGYFIWFIAGAIFHLVVVLIFLLGIRSERRSLLLPFLFLATFGVFVLIILVSINFVLAVQNSSGQKIYLGICKTTLGIIIHIWGISVVWRCYFYFGHKKLAERIHEQLQTSSLAFARDYSQPASYMDTAEESPLITV